MGISGEGLAPQLVEYISTWISAWTWTRGGYGLPTWASTSYHVLFLSQTLVTQLAFDRIYVLCGYYSLGLLMGLFYALLLCSAQHLETESRHETPRTQEIPLPVDEIPLSTTVIWERIFKLHLSAKGENQFLLAVCSEWESQGFKDSRSSFVNVLADAWNTTKKKTLMSKTDFGFHSCSHIFHHLQTNSAQVSWATLNFRGKV